MYDRAPLPPLAAVRAFEAAARHGNFTRAGEELGMTQAAVSYQIKVLEDRTGAPLFRRNARGVSLTSDGERLAARAGEALEILRDAFAEAKRDSAETLVISALASFATHVLATRLGRFTLAHPGINTRIEVDHRMADLLAGEASVAIRSGTGKWPGLGADLLIRARYTPMISPAFIARHGPLTEPSDLLHLPLIDAVDPLWAKWFRAAGLTPPDPGGSGALLGSQMLEVQAALAGHGVCLLTPLYFHDALARGELIQPFDLISDDDISIWLVYPERRRNAPAIRAFRDWMAEEIRALEEAAAIPRARAPTGA